MKVVGRRSTLGNAIRDAEILQRTASKLQGGALVPRGVYRFESHEEADQWMMRTIAHTHARTSALTLPDPSFGSPARQAVAHATFMERFDIRLTDRGAVWLSCQWP